MRELIDAIEKAFLAESAEATVADVNVETVAETEIVQELAGDDRLTGSLDPRALAKLLPEVDDLNRFVNAVRKVMKGDIATLNMQENRQLAKAFISVLRDDSQMTMKVMQKLKLVHSNDDQTAEEPTL